MFQGAPKPDISSVAAFKRTLLNAKSIAHTVHGPSGASFPGLIERLGIAEGTRDVAGELLRPFEARYWKAKPEAAAEPAE